MPRAPEKKQQQQQQQRYYDDRTPDYWGMVNHLLRNTNAILVLVLLATAGAAYFIYVFFPGLRAYLLALVPPLPSFSFKTHATLSLGSRSLMIPLRTRSMLEVLWGFAATKAAAGVITGITTGIVLYLILGRRSNKLLV